ncbi:MAG: hypothetical protein R2865_00870 [Deinococcales bacterium]
MRLTSHVMLQTMNQGKFALGGIIPPYTPFNAQGGQFERSGKKY